MRKEFRSSDLLTINYLLLTRGVAMTLYDDMIEGVIDIHCHIDFEFSAKERKREPEFLWLPKAEAMGVRGVVLKSHWWPTVNVAPYILAAVQTKVELWSSVA